MSILSFLKGILSLFINNFPAFVKRLFDKIPDELKEQLAIIIKVVENIKIFVDSPAADFITTVIPGTADDKFKDWLKAVLPEVLEKLGVLNNQVITLSSDQDTRSAQLHSIGAILNKKLTETSFGQASITTEVVYQNS